MLNAELKILGGKYQGKTIPLAAKRFLVGREQDCQLRPNSELVSRHHCVFITDDYAVRLRDLGSTNGTRVNGDLVRGETVLKPGDRVTIGRLELEVVICKPSEVAVVAVAAPPSAATPAGGTPMEMPIVEVPAGSTLTGTTKTEDTNYEIPASQEATPTVIASNGDTTIIPGAAGAPMAPLQGYPQMPQMGFPMGYGYVMPGYPQPMPGYGYGMPGGYPMGMPMMPQYPMQQQPNPPSGNAPQAGGAGELPVRLPDPSQTGVTAPPPAAPGAAPASGTQETPSTSAADIIKGYMQRRMSH